MSVLDPFYLVKEEIQDSVNKLQATFARWEQLPTSSIQDFLDLSKELSTGCETIEWQVDELDRAIAVAERDPARFSIDVAEIERRKKWTSSTHNQIFTIRKALQNSADVSAGRSQQPGNRREFSRLPDDTTTKRAAPRENESFNYESDRQALMMREQDDDLDDLSDAVGRIAEVGLVIHTELSSQDTLIDELDKDMDHTSNRLDFVQKRIAAVLKKASWKAQACTILTLVGLLIVLTYLVFNA
ncbi:unnamed protein product [Calypogeia fissa]